MEIGITILGEVTQKHKDHMMSHMWNLKHDTNELTYERETDSQT